MSGIRGNRARAVLALAAATAAAVIAQPAAAANDQRSMGVSATVNANCTVSTSPVAFGNVNVISGSATTGQGGITVKCTNGTSWTATASVGSGTGATVATRKMTHATDATKTLDYALYTDSGRSTLWGNGSSGGSLTGTGTGSDQAQTIYASVPTGQHAATLGNYSDSVTVTVTY